MNNEPLANPAEFALSNASSAGSSVVPASWASWNKIRRQSNFPYENKNKLTQARCKRQEELALSNASSAGSSVVPAL